MKSWLRIYEWIYENGNPCKIFLIKVTQPVYLILINVEKNVNTIFQSFENRIQIYKLFFFCFYD